MTLTMHYEASHVSICCLVFLPLPQEECVWAPTGEKRETEGGAAPANVSWLSKPSLKQSPTQPSVT